MYSRVNPARRLNHAIFVTMAMSGSAVWLGQATPRIAHGAVVWFGALSPSLSHPFPTHATLCAQILKNRAMLAPEVF